MKESFWQAFQPPRSLRCELEFPIGDRWADVYVEQSSGVERVRIAIEVQHSALPATEVAEKRAAYKAQGVHCLYIVHAAAFPGYKNTSGIVSLHQREISVPEWIREIATPDLESIRPEAAFAEGPFVPFGRTYVQVWADGRLWALELRMILRESYWNNRYDIRVLGGKFTGRLLGELLLEGSVLCESEPGLACFAAVTALAAEKEPHPSLLRVYEESSRRLRDSSRENEPAKRGGLRCRPMSNGTTPEVAPPLGIVSAPNAAHTEAPSQLRFDLGLVD